MVPIYQFRADALHPGESAFFWFPKTHGLGGSYPQPILPDGWTFFSPSNIGGGSAWHRLWAWGIQASADAIPGIYAIPFGETFLNITVVPNPQDRPLVQVLPSGSSRLDTQSALLNGNDVELLPGMHKWYTAVVVPDGASIYSAGAWIIKQPSADYAHRMFVPQGNMRLEGVTLTHDQSIRASGITYLHAYPSTKGIVDVRRCTLKGGNLCQGIPAICVSECIFDRAGTGQAGSGSVWNNNDFYGQTTYGHHSFFSTGANGCLVTSNRWHYTNRGMVLQTGDCRGFVVMDNYFFNIQGGQLNAGECILLEGGNDGLKAPDDTHGMRNNAFIGTYIIGCSGPGISLYGSGMHDNTFWDLKCDVEAVGIAISALKGGRMTNNTFVNCCLSGRMDFTGDVGNVDMQNITFIDTVQRAGNGGIIPRFINSRNMNYPFYIDAIALDKGRFNLRECWLQSRTARQAITRVQAI